MKRWRKEFNKLGNYLLFYLCCKHAAKEKDKIFFNGPMRYMAEILGIRYEILGYVNQECRKIYRRKSKK